MAELKIGCHLSVAKGFEHMGKEALAIGGNTFQYFSRNPRGSKAKEMNPVDVEKLKTIIAENNFNQLLAHAPYTLNPCAKDEKIRLFALMVMKSDLDNLEYLPGNYYNFHPGSHVGQGREKGVALIVETINAVLKPHYATTILLETMAGKGTEIGGTFEELKEIIDGVELKDKIGVCLDTCHVYDGGYDIVHNLDGVLTKFDSIIGLDRLHAIHLNDSMNPFASHKDRHAKIGEGAIGFEAIARVINHAALKTLPFYLETPNELDGYAHEIAILKEAYKG